MPKTDTSTKASGAPRASQSRLVLDQIADKWSVLILAALCHGPLRFNALKRALGGITQTALTQALKRLERNGIIARRVLVAKPIAVTYSITPVGRTLEPLFRALDTWTHEHLAEIERAQKAFDLANSVALTDGPVE